MAQTVPPPGDSIPRPLPRGGRSTSARNARPRFQPADALWMALLAGLSAAVALARGGFHPTALYSAAIGAGAITFTYLLGWRASGRAAGVIAGLLLASTPAVASPSFALLRDATFALLSVAALFAFVAGSSLAALALTVGATALRPEGLLLGVLLLTLSLVQRRKRAAWGAALFLLSVAVAGYALLHGGDNSLTASWGWHPTLLRWLIAPPTAFLTWFLLPFCGELGESQRRARWLPVVLWAALLLVWLTLAPRGASGALTPFLPLWAVLVGAGLARLLPALTGDIPMPTARYVIATVAVLSLVALHARPEQRPTLPPPIAVPVPAPVPPAELLPPSAPPDAVTPPVATLPVTPRPVRHPAKKPMLKPKPIHAAVANKPAKPAVPLYMVKNGRLVRRSKWAIQWDLTHPH